MQTVICCSLQIKVLFVAVKAACLAVSFTVILEDQGTSTIANLNSAFPQPGKRCCLLARWVLFLVLLPLDIQDSYPLCN